MWLLYTKNGLSQNKTRQTPSIHYMMQLLPNLIFDSALLELRDTIPYIYDTFGQSVQKDS